MKISRRSDPNPTFSPLYGFEVAALPLIAESERAIIKIIGTDRSIATSGG